MAVLAADAQESFNLYFGAVADALPPFKATMNSTTLSPRSRPLAADPELDVHAAGQSHSICWGAVFAGAACAASLSLILLVLGVGLGLSSISPWSSKGVSAETFETFGVPTIIWLTFAQFAASGLGGYLAGRLRHRWSRAHTDEVYFRDTAHGFLAWSVATPATASMGAATPARPWQRRAP